MSVHPGQIVAGKYRIERVLGQGGMGVVVAAMHVQLEERVAIKFLLPEALESAETVARFAREARAAVKIKSEHVARVIDVGAFDNGAPYMVMEYLDGEDLAARVRRGGPLGVELAVAYVAQAIEAIAEAHSLGIVHRDLKPSNLFLTHRPDGTPLVKVLDFGISKMIRAGGMQDAAMTSTSAVLGSPMYMAPEQMVATRDVDARADIWALGIVLYQLLAGRAPFDGTTMTELCARILQEPPIPLRSLRPDVPPALEAAIVCCLEKDRVKRFNTIADLAGALAPFGGRTAVAAAERARRLLPVTERASHITPQPLAPIPDFALQATHASWSSTHGARDVRSASDSPVRASASGGPWVAIVLAAAALIAGVAVGIGVLVARNMSSGATRATHDSHVVETSPPPAPTQLPNLAPAANPSAELSPLHVATPGATLHRPPSAPPTTAPAHSSTQSVPPPPTTAARPDIF